MPVNYYDDNAQSFYDSTVDVDMAGLYSKFLPVVGDTGRILDLGCGSGRDAKHFIDLGYEVDAIDASKEMVRLASIKSGLEVRHMTFEQFMPDFQYDGIWACASLLHVEPNDLKKLFVRISKWLNTSGVLYVSFKYGDGIRVKDGRTFTDMDDRLLKGFLRGTDLVLNEFWLTQDQRPRRNEQWLNALVMGQTGH